MSDKIKYIGNAAEEPDNVIKQAIGEYESVFIIGWDKHNKLDARASLNMSDEDVIYLNSSIK